MKVLLYTESEKVIGKSGLGKAIKHQAMALSSAGIDYTFDLKDDYDILHWQNELKDCKDAKRAKRLNKRIRKTYAKKAAHKVLGMRLRWLPFAFCYMWRKIYHCSEKVSATINATEMISENKVFYLANLGSSKQALVLSMSQVGEAVEQRIKRGESAESMVEQDGLEKKADSK